MLLQRSGLEATERSVIVANLKNQFTTSRVKEALKLTWPDEELKRRDAGRNSAMFTREEENAMMAEDFDDQNLDVDWAEKEEELQSAYQALEEEAQHAFTALQGARRTLRDARERQAQMRKNRNFFKDDRRPGGPSGGDRPPVKCFRCGGPHLKRDCPEKPSEANTRSQCAFVFSAFQGAALEPEENKLRCPDLQALAAEREDEKILMTLEDVIKQGKAIIDGGATSSLGSEEAVRQVAEMNWRRSGHDGLEIDPDDKPNFRFGNNGRQACLSTAKMAIPLGDRQGTMKVHIHEIPGQPVLLSIQALKALGAVIDYSNNQVILRHVDPKKVAVLETTEGGHQLFPLTQDILSGAFTRATAFQSLKEEASSHE